MKYIHLTLIALLITLTSFAQSAITGSTVVCVGNTTTLGDATTGGTWSSSNAAIAAVGSSTGVVTGIASGSATISYTVGTSSVTSPMSVSAVLPNIHNVIGGGPYCPGGSGSSISLDASDAGITYQLFLSGTAVGSPLTGTGASIDFGFHSIPGTYTVMAINNLTGCSVAMSGSAIVSLATLPHIYVVSLSGGSGAICSGGAGLDVVLSGSDMSVNYQLIVNGFYVGAFMTGTTLSLNFGPQTAPGLYSVMAFDAITGCTVMMADSPSITLLSSPATISGASSVCAGASGTLTDAVSGGIWSSSNTAIATIGSASGVATGIASGTTIITYRLSTGCTTTSTLPVVNTVPPITGTTTLCAGATSALSDGGGVWTSSAPAVATVGSTTGLVTSVSAGTARITFTSSGSCGVVNTTVTVNPLPTPYILSFSGGHDSACNYGAGVHLVLSGSNSSVSYELFNIAGPILGPISGTGSALDFGLFSYSGSFYAIGTSISSSCDNNMSGTANLFDAPSAIIGSSSVCLGGTDSLSDSLSLGVWHSSNIAVATVGSASGVVSGVGLGTSVITFTVTGGCYSTLTVSVVSSCSGTPVAGTASAVYSSVCSGNSDTISLSGYTVACGITLQWQSSPDGTTWTNISGAVAGYYVATPSVSTYFRCKVTCSSGGLYAYSTSTLVTIHDVIASHSVITTPDTLCSGSHFYISACGVSSAFNVTTFYGDGTSDNNALTSTGICHADIYHFYTSPGTYTVKQVLYLGTSPQDSVTFSCEYLYCHTLPVKFYFDHDSNCVFNSGDAYITLPISVEVDSNGVVLDTLSVTSGLYYKALGGTGTVYKFKVLSTSYGLYSSCPSSGIIYDTILAYTNVYPDKYIAFRDSTSTFFDLEINSTLLTGRHIATGSIIVNNNQPMLESGVVTLHFSNKYYSITASPTPTTVSGNTATWNLSPLASYSTPISISYTLHVFDEWTTYAYWNTPGDTVQTFLSVGPTSGDIDTSNNFVNLIDTVNSAYDPNEMTVSPSGYILPCTWLQYTINFENTGNDTAHNISVIDTLPPYVNPRTLKLIIASATMNTSIVHSGGYNIVKFDFPGINLPDSAHHNQCTGMLVFKIKTLQALSDGNLILNHAAIFFDDNPAVLTDTVEDIIGINPIIGPNSFCNTTTDTLTINATGGAWHSAFTNATVSNGIVTGVVPGVDIISYTLTNACTSRTATKTVTINSSVTPDVNIFTGIGDTVCGGVSVTYVATPVNGGATPVYEWDVNGLSAGVGYSFSYLPVNGDIVTVKLISNASCALPDSAFASDTMYVISPLIPSVDISANPGFNIPYGWSDTLTATVTGGGLSPVYQWLVNNNPVPGANTSVYITDTLNNGDSVTCMVTSSGQCGGYSTFNSVGIGVGAETVNPLNALAIELVLAPNPNNGEFTLRGTIGTTDEKATIEITDMPGRVIYSSNILAAKGVLNEKVHLNNLSKGIYMLNLHSGLGNKVLDFVVE